MKFILVSSLIIVLGTILTGVYLLRHETVVSKKKMKQILSINIITYVPLLIGAIVFFIPNVVYALEEGSTNAGYGFIAAALSTGFSTIGAGYAHSIIEAMIIAGYAVGAVGSSAIGAVSEDQAILGKTLIFVGLAEGIAIYGLIISILILGRL